MNPTFQKNLDTIINTIKIQRNPEQYLQSQLNMAMNENPMLKDIIMLLLNKNSDKSTLEKVMTSICNEYGINTNDSLDYIKRNIK